MESNSDEDSDSENSEDDNNMDIESNEWIQNRSQYDTNWNI